MRLLPLFAFLCLATTSQAQPDNNRAGSDAGAQQAAGVSENGPAVIAPVNRQINAAEEAQPNQGEPYAEERDQREWRDLIAQERMAKWAKAAFWAIVAQTVLAFGALTALILDLRQNRRSAERQLRAYLVLQPIVIDKIVEGESPLSITFPIENAGSTPANKLVLHWNWKITPEEPTSQLYGEITALYPCENEPDRSIGPRHVKGAKKPITIPNYWRLKVISGEMKFYVAGWLRYTDAFEKSHTTEFFYYYTENLPNRMGQVNVHNRIG